LLLFISSACQPSTALSGAQPTSVQQESFTSTETPSPTRTPMPGPVETASASSAPGSEAVQALDLAFADSDWDGAEIPAGQQCSRQGGENPSTPSIHVGSIPAGTDAIILEFSDRTYAPMNNGGHGKIGVEISRGTNEAVIPSVPGHTFELPQGFFLVEEHRAPSFDTAGAYMPPCSGGAGNSYYVTVKAVQVLSKEDKSFALLGEGVLDLGKY
jgi:hypothetical protein